MSIDTIKVSELPLGTLENTDVIPVTKVVPVDIDNPTGFKSYKIIATDFFKGIEKVGTHYIVPTATGTYVQNGTSFSNALAAAAAMTPGGNPLSATNRVAVVLMPAIYQTATLFTLSAEFVDVVGMTGDPKSAILIGGTNTLNQTANDIRVSGVTIDCTSAAGVNNAYHPNTDLPLTIMENVIVNAKGTSRAMRGGVKYSGTYTNIKVIHTSTATCYAFGSDNEASGTFTNCSVDVQTAVTDFSFAGFVVTALQGKATGTFINCSSKTLGASKAFGGSGIASGTFRYCTTTSGTNMDNSSFGGNDTCTGNFYNCDALSGGTNNAFAGNGVALSCTAIECTTTAGLTHDNNSFGGIMSVTTTGTFERCRAFSIGGAIYAFGGDSVDVTGVYTDCKSVSTTGDSKAFAGGSGEANGQFIRCTVTSTDGEIRAFGFNAAGYFEGCQVIATNGSAYSYGSNSSTGIFKGCVAKTEFSNYCFSGDGGSANGEYYDCSVFSLGDTGAFGGNGGNANGIFRNCSVTISSPSTDVDYSFAGGGNAGGSFYYCSVKGNKEVFAFGGDGGGAGGFFEYCTTISGAGTNNYSFGGNGTADGTFNHCKVIAGFEAGGFGGKGDASGKFNYCSSVAGDIDYSFGGNGNATGVFNYCTSSTPTNTNNTFGGGGGVGSGEFNYCITEGASDDSFAGDGDATGIFIGCKSKSLVDYSNAFGGFGVCSGTFLNCSAMAASPTDNNSFGAGAIASGYYNNIDRQGQWATDLRGRVYNTEIVALGTDEDGITNVKTAAHIHNCTVRSTGTGSSLNTSVPTQSPKITHSRFNSNFSGITNGISSNFNVIDVNI